MSQSLHGSPNLFAYGEGDFNGYWLLALLLITFINWVATQLKQRRARKRGESFEIDPEDFAPYRDRIEQGASSAKEEVIARGGKATDDIRDFFASLTGQQPAPPKPEPVHPPDSVPPPVPASAATRKAPAVANAYLQRVPAAIGQAVAAKSKIVLSDAAKAAAAEYQRQFGSTDKARSTRSRNRHDSMTRLLREPGSLRTAIILREILGPPKSLQSDRDTPTL